MTANNNSYGYGYVKIREYRYGIPNPRRPEQVHTSERRKAIDGWYHCEEKKGNSRNSEAFKSECCKLRWKEKKK